MAQWFLSFALNDASGFRTDFLLLALENLPEYINSFSKGKGKGKGIPVRAYYRPIVFQDAQASKNSALEGGKVFSTTHRPPSPPRNNFWYSFLLWAG